MNKIKLVQLSELRAVIEAGGVLSVTLEGAGTGFATRLTTRSGALSLASKNTGQQRVFADPRTALALFKQMGIVEVRIDTRNWSTDQKSLA